MIDRLAEFAVHMPLVAELRIGRRGPVKVYQRGRFMGTVPGWPVRSTSAIFDVRANDFVPRNQDGEGVLDASPMIGPGDFACIDGYVPAPDLPAAFADRGMADIFDGLLRELGGR